MRTRINLTAEQYMFITEAWSSEPYLSPLPYWLKKQGIRIKYIHDDVVIICEETDWMMFLLRYS